jgi:hypothetical protein
LLASLAHVLLDLPPIQRMADGGGLKDDHGEPPSAEHPNDRGFSWGQGSSVAMQEHSYLLCFLGRMVDVMRYGRA